MKVCTVSPCWTLGIHSWESQCRTKQCRKGIELSDLENEGITILQNLKVKSFAQQPKNPVFKNSPR